MSACQITLHVRSLRTAAMGVLLLHLQIEMGASVWEDFPQLQSLPESALHCFVCAQCLPIGMPANELPSWAEHYRRLLAIYRQCRYTFHALSCCIGASRSHPSGTPAILTALSTERWPTFREMFPGIKSDDTEEYGPACVLQLPGKHIAMINRCLSNNDQEFTYAVEWCATCRPTSTNSNDMRDRGPLVPCEITGFCMTVLRAFGGGVSIFQSGGKTQSRFATAPSLQCQACNWAAYLVLFQLLPLLLPLLLRCVRCRL